MDAENCSEKKRCQKKRCQEPFLREVILCVGKERSYTEKVPDTVFPLDIDKWKKVAKAAGVKPQ